MIEFVVPWPPKILRASARPHWAVKAKAAKAYKTACYYAALQAVSGQQWLAEKYKLSLEFCPSVMRNRDDDNLIAIFKHGRDGIAQAMKIDDKKFQTSPPVVRKDAAAKQAYVIVRIEALK